LGSINQSDGFSTNKFNVFGNDSFINNSRADGCHGDNNDDVMAGADLVTTDHMGNKTTIELSTTPHCLSPPRPSTVTPEIERRHWVNIACNATMMAEWEKVAKEVGIPNKLSKGKDTVVDSQSHPC
jgi:hypothetical protein